MNPSLILTRTTVRRTERLRAISVLRNGIGEIRCHEQRRRCWMMVCDESLMNRVSSQGSLLFAEMQQIDTSMHRASVNQRLFRRVQMFDVFLWRQLRVGTTRSEVDQIF